jgi:hypothetical protein
MHDTARCLGYPSDSSREARECARGTSCRGRHPRRAGQARPGRILPLCFRSWPVRLVPVTLHAPRQHSASVRGGPTSSMLSPSVGVGHSPLAVGLGPSAGLLVGVPDRRLVSPLSSPRACSGAGPGWHGCGWNAVSAVLSEGPAPWRWTLHLRSPLGGHRGGGSPAARVRDFLLSRLAGVGHCSLAVGLGSSAGLLVGVPDRRPVSPLSSPRACSGRVRAGTVAGGSPSAPYCLSVWRRGAGPCSCAVRWAVTVVADRQRRAAAPVTGTPRRARPASWSERHRGCAFVQVAVSSNRASGRPGQVGHWAATVSSPIQAATGQLTRGRWRSSRMRYQLSPPASNAGAPGAGRTRTRMLALAGPRSRSDHGS